MKEKIIKIDEIWLKLNFSEEFDKKLQKTMNKNSLEN